MGTRKIRFFRLDENGNRVPHTLVLTLDLVEVSCLPDAPPPIDPGIELYNREKDVGVVATKEPRIIFARWVTESFPENPIPGTDELRQEYFKALAAMKQKAEDEGVECRNCDLGNLMRSYKAKLDL